MGAELGRLPDVAIPDDPQLIKATTAEGVPFVLAQPKAKATQEIMHMVQRLTAQPDPAAVAAAAAPAMEPTSH
jgi:MinD-like ATPase involved in chromosome partitioning or flagellar assembly